MWGGTGIPPRPLSRHCISIHPPRVGRDLCVLHRNCLIQTFQSTLPVWGGTPVPGDCITASADFNPPSPCGEGPDPETGEINNLDISIHPPRVGRDIFGRKCLQRTMYFNPPSPCGEGRDWELMTKRQYKFQSTLPVWGGTESCCSISTERMISIHPPRVGRDSCAWRWSACAVYFNPPSPCGEGLAGTRSIGRAFEFQSTLPVWGGTLRQRRSFSSGMKFQSTLPVWGGTGNRRRNHLPCVRISIHPPRVGRDISAGWFSGWVSSFQSTLPVWGGTWPVCVSQRVMLYFNPPSPCGEGQPTRQLH